MLNKENAKCSSQACKTQGSWKTQTSPKGLQCLRPQLQHLDKTLVYGKDNAMLTHFGFLAGAEVCWQMWVLVPSNSRCSLNISITCGASCKALRQAVTFFSSGFPRYTHFLFVHRNRNIFKAMETMQAQTCRETYSGTHQEQPAVPSLVPSHPTKVSGASLQPLEAACQWLPLPCCKGWQSYREQQTRRKNVLS